MYGVDDTERLFEIVLDDAKDKPIELPILCLRRLGAFTVQNISKKPMAFDGVTLDASENISKTLNAIPIDINYQLDIYTRYRLEAEEYARNLVFNIINYPKVDVIIPYMGYDYIHSSSIVLSPQVDNNSDIPERLSFGQFTRYTINFSIQNAYLWDIQERPNYSMVTDVITNEDKIEPCNC